MPHGMYSRYNLTAVRRGGFLVMGTNVPSSQKEEADYATCSPVSTGWKKHGIYS